MEVYLEINANPINTPIQIKFKRVFLLYSEDNNDFVTNNMLINQNNNWGVSGRMKIPAIINP